MLQIFHVYLMQHQEDIQNERHHRTSSRYRISPEVRNAYRTDSSGYYFIVQDIFGSGKQHAPADLAIVTHTTSNHLQNLLHLSRRWEGLISVSVFTHGQDVEFALHLSQRLYECYKEIEQKVIFHLVFPVSCNITNIPYHQVNCDVEDTIKSSNKNFELGGKLRYPHNVLRNLALKTVEARFILAMDIDMLPSANLFGTFQRNLISSITSSNQTAYILPVFETGENYNIPSTKDELLQDKNIQPFYANVCQKCQYITDYDRWKHLGKSEALDVAYDLQWTHPYEPFYIASKSSLPLYDERFKQYGFNRVSQVRSFLGSR